MPEMRVLQGQDLPFERPLMHDVERGTKECVCIDDDAG